jgi:hypothetical protein
VNKANIDIRAVIGGIFKILLLCLVVGFILSVVDFDALGFIRFLSNSVRKAGDLAAEGVRWAVPYILLGAIVVVPVYVIKLGLDLLRRRKK